MSIIKSPRGMRLVLAGLLLGTLLSACGGDPEPTDEDPVAKTPANVMGRKAEGVPVPPDLARAFGRLLTQRANAVLAQDEDRYTATLARNDPQFLAAQQAYFDNLEQLPFSEFSYTLDKSSLVRSGADYSVVISLKQQLTGFDDAPNVTQHRFRFSPVRGKPSAFVLSSVTDAAWEQANNVQLQPWEMLPIQVREAPGVLGVFDSGSVQYADSLTQAMSSAVADISARVPYVWPGTVVFYALSSTRFLDTLDDLPGGDPAHIDAVAFPVMAGPGNRTTVATRISLTPDALGRPAVERDRLLRHEMAHVAIGTNDDKAPVWLAEGIAEYLSVQMLPPQQRRVTEAALAFAESGVSGMPSDDTFNLADAPANYALSWWACEFLADTYGESSLFSLLDATADGGRSTSDTMRDFFDLSATQAAKRGAKLMIMTYDPKFYPPDPPPTTETPDPTRGADPTTPATPKPSPR